MKFGGAGLLAWALLPWVCALGNAQDARVDSAKDFVWEAVRAELAADAADHSRWLYYEVDVKPGDGVVQWVAQTSLDDLDRVLELDGHRLSLEAQRSRINAFIHDPAAQARQRKGGVHDDREATEMLNLLPNAFIWTKVGQQQDLIVLHFRPDPNFNPPTWESRVFAAMEGDMAVDQKQHRIVSLKGRMIHDVKFAWGILGELQAGGTFDVERRQIAPGIWQITQSHIHIQGHALIFKSISEQEDDVKSRFEQLPSDITFQQAEEKLFAQSE